MKKLVIDIGNTLVKVSLFENKDLKELSVLSVSELDKVVLIINSWEFSHAILSSVRDYPVQILEKVSNADVFIELNENTPLPLTNLYETPSTLGKDRLAAACGAHTLFPDNNVIVINAGTCITYDVVTSSGQYQGGSISPGLMMRFKALHTFTGRLPLLSAISPVEIPGKNTEDSLLSGVLLGTLEEVKGMISLYQQYYPESKVILSGGDSSFFENQLKSGIFAAQNIVLLGLNEILDYNV